MKISDVLAEFDNVLKEEGIDKDTELTDDQKEGIVNHFDLAFDAVSTRENEDDEDVE